MITKTHRFHGRNSLRYVYQNGQTTRGPFFAIKSSLNPKRQTYRGAVIISRKIHKSAVTRNRLRRRIYEVIRELGGDIIKPYDIVITVFSDKLIEEPPKSLSRHIKKQLGEAGILAKQLSR
jgi:ribonuclease P protein component